MHTMTRKITLALMIPILALIAATQAEAQPQQAGPWFYDLNLGGVHQSDADLKDGGGAFSTDRWFLSGGVNYAWDARNSIGVSLGGGRSIYEFDGLGAFGGGDPWHRVNETRLTLNWRFGFGDKGTAFVIPGVYMQGEQASTGGNTTFGLFAAAAWRVRDGLTIGPGFGLFSRLESGVSVFPVLAIDWDITERWNLSTGSGLGASRGPGLTLRYTLNDDWSLGLTGRYEDFEFRLDDKGPAAGGIGRDQSFPLVFLASLKPNPKFGLSVFAGLELGGKLKLSDADGERLDESSFDPAPVLGASLVVNF